METQNRENIDFIIDKFNNFATKEWDFNYLNTKNRNKSNYRLKFDNIPSCYYYYCKMMALNEFIILKNSIGTIKVLVERIKPILNKLYEDGIFDVRLINKKIIKKYMENWESTNKPSYIVKKAVTLIKFINTIEDIENIQYIDIKEYLYEKQKEYSQFRALTAVNDYIPDSFSSQIVSLAYDDINNTKLQYNERIFACLLIILEETGIRAEELSLLESNKILPKEHDGNKVDFIEFYTFKTIGKEKEFELTHCFLTQLASTAYHRCEDLVKEIIDNLSENSLQKLLYFLYSGEEIVSKKRLPQKYKDILNNLSEIELKDLFKKALKYLFINHRTGRLIHGTSPLREASAKFFVRHRDDIDLSKLNSNESEQIRYFNIESQTRYEKFFSVKERKSLSFNDCKNIKIPYVGLHQFRVTLCTKLFMNDVHIDYIMKHMNHLSEDMTAYYNKSNTLRDELEESINILNNMTNSKGIIETDIDKIDDELVKYEFDNEIVKAKIKKVNEFLEKNNLNINKDIGKIMKLLLKTNTTIAENEFGMCIRSLINGVCEKKKYFSSMSDNYFVGIQLENYDFIHNHYERFIQKRNIVNHNKQVAEKDFQYLNEFQRELKALKMYVDKTLLREITILENDINKLGSEYIKSQHQNIGFFVDNIDTIKGEVETWREKF